MFEEIDIEKLWLKVRLVYTNQNRVKLTVMSKLNYIRTCNYTMGTKIFKLQD